MNAKEKNELLLKLMVVLVRDRRAMQGRIRSVGYTREYGELPRDLGVYTLGQLPEDELVRLAESVQIRKMKPLGAKSDIYMNDVGYVICNFTQDRPVIIDGLTREEMAAVCRLANVPCELLDQRMREYAELRRSGAVTGEVAIADPASPFKDDREYLGKVIRYYMFEGSESGPSMFPAECAFDYTDPLNTNTWIIYEPEEMIEAIWDRLVLSVSEGEAHVAEQASDAISPDVWSEWFGCKGKARLSIRVK